MQGWFDLPVIFFYSLCMTSLFSTSALPLWIGWLQFVVAILDALLPATNVSFPDSSFLTHYPTCLTPLQASICLPPNPAYVLPSHSTIYSLYLPLPPRPPYPSAPCSSLSRIGKLKIGKMDWFFEKETLKTPLDYLKIIKFTPFFISVRALPQTTIPDKMQKLDKTLFKSLHPGPPSPFSSLNCFSPIPSSQLLSPPFVY